MIQAIDNMVGAAGFEPATPSSQTIFPYPIVLISLAGSEALSRERMVKPHVFLCRSCASSEQEHAGTVGTPATRSTGFAFTSRSTAFTWRQGTTSMRLNAWDQRQLDIESGLELDRNAARKHAREASEVGAAKHRTGEGKMDNPEQHAELNDPAVVKHDASCAPWLDPTPEMLASPEFEAVWQCIKRWDINVPDQYVGYCGATGNHVRAILDALRRAVGDRERVATGRC